jgi:hypothetical protein
MFDEPHDDLDADPTADDPLAARLAAERPAPRAGYRGMLRRRLIALGPPAARPPHLARLASIYGVVGAVLLGVGLLSLGGIGPLAP